MKKTVFGFILMIAVMPGISVLAQDEGSTENTYWYHELNTGFYFFPDDFIVLPVYQLNRDWLHLEARYHYEGSKTFSAWIGYNFSGGGKFRYTITPMAGGIAGNTRGIAPGLELTFDFCGFEFYSESEYVFDLQGKEGDFYYNWTDVTWSPLEWLWIGLSMQRTKLYETELDIQRGILVGGSYRWFGLSGYLYNLVFDEPYFIISFTVSFPE
jgi:hypothetical protein